MHHMDAGRTGTFGYLKLKNQITTIYIYKLLGRPARIIQQLCEDTGCNPEDLPEAMSDREKWRETVRDIRADGAT